VGPLEKTRANKPRPEKRPKNTLELGGHEFYEIAAAAGVAPFVVVPRQNFDTAVTDDLGVAGIYNGRVRIAFEIGRDELFLGVAKNALHGAEGRGFESSVDGLHARGFVHKNGDIDDADIGSGHAHGVAIELALQFGDDKMQGFGRPGRAGDHVDRSGTRAAKILMGQIEKFLIIRIGVDGGHGSTVNAESLLQDLGDRGQAIRGAGGVGNHMVLRRIVGLVVDAKDQGSVGPVGGRGDDDFFYRTTEMLLCVNALREEAGGFDDDVRADAGPIDFGRILHLENLEGFALDGDGVVGVSDVVREIAKDGIVFEQVREGLGVGDVVDGDELDVLVVERGAHDVPSDAAEAVDADLDGHTTSVGMFGTAAGSLERNGRNAEHKMLWAAWSKVNAKPQGRNLITK